MLALFALQVAPFKKMLDDYSGFLSADLGDVPFYTAMSTLLDQMHMKIPDFLGNEIIPEEIPLNEKYNSVALNDLQKYVVRNIYEKVINNFPDDPYLMFLQGRAGTGKTFTTNVIINVLRKKGYKILVTGTTGIAAAQYEKGMTCHSLFKLKLAKEDSENDYRYNIGYGTNRSKELLESNLIIIDEISMMNIQTVFQIDYTLRTLVAYHEKQGMVDHLNLENIPPFGGKNILFVGDLLQLPPVVRGSDESVSNKLITKCPFWSMVKLFGLKEPVRCTNKKWNDFLVDIGNRCSNQYNTWYDLISDFGIEVTRDYKKAINFFTNGVDLKGIFPIDRQWICAKNFNVKDVNNYFHMLRINENHSNDMGSFYSSTTITNIVQSDIASKKLNMTEAFDYLNVLNFKDMPNHKLDLARGEPMCLMRNINTAKGMAKNKRCYVVKRTQKWVVVEFEDKSQATIPRINFPGETYGISFIRHQIPLRPIYAGTIHKSQGLTLDRVVVDMRSKNWEHGQELKIQKICVYFYLKTSKKMTI